MRPLSAPTDLRVPLLSRFVDVRKHELGVLAAATVGFFCVLASYFLLKPLRDEYGIQSGNTSKLPLLWTGTLGFTLLLSPLFAWLVSRYPRRTFLPTTYRFFALNLLVFVALLRSFDGTALTWTKYAFYFWVSTFNLFVVSVWWGFMADLFRLEQSRRLFGCIAVGGTLGAIVGAWFTSTAVGTIGSTGLMLCSVGLLEVGAQLAGRLARRMEASEIPKVGSERASRGGAERGVGNAWSGMQRVLASPFMRAVAVYVVLQTLASTFLSMQVNQLVAEAKSTAVERTQAFANRDMWTQITTLALQMFITGRVITKLGVSATLVIQPFVTIAGFTLLAWALPDAPSPGGGFPADEARLGFALATAICFEALFRATQNAFARPARETLFTVVDREEKYKSKSFIDTFVWRGGDTLFGWIHKSLREQAALPTTLIASLVIPFAGAWMVLSWFLGRTQRRLANERD